MCFLLFKHCKFQLWHPILDYYCFCCFLLFALLCNSSLMICGLLIDRFALFCFLFSQCFIFKSSSLFTAPFSNRFFSSIFCFCFFLLTKPWNTVFCFLLFKSFQYDMPSFEKKSNTKQWYLLNNKLWCKSYKLQFLYLDFCFNEFRKKVNFMFSNLIFLFVVKIPVFLFFYLTFFIINNLKLMMNDFGQW